MNHELLLNDNAANTTVVNTGTGSDWTASENTSGLHSATAKEGSGSFNFTATGQHIKSNENWTGQNIALTFWWRPEDTTAFITERIFALAAVNGTSAPSYNEFYFERASGSNQFKIAASGATVYNTNISTTDFSPSAGTWYFIKLVVDCSASPWDIYVGYNTDGSDIFTELTFGSWSATPDAATFNAPLWFGCSGGFMTDALIDYAQIWDPTTSQSAVLSIMQQSNQFNGGII